MHPLFSSLTDISAQNGLHEPTTSAPPSDHDEDNSPGYTGNAIFSLLLLLLLLSFQYCLSAWTICTVSLCDVQNKNFKNSYDLLYHSESVAVYSFSITAALTVVVSLIQMISCFYSNSSFTEIV